MVDAELFEKLRKIKALADDAKDDHECETAMLMFQRLMEKNGLDASAIEVEEERQALDEVDIYQGLRVENWLHYLHSTIAKHFRCVAVVSISPRVGTNAKTLQFIGHARDAAIAKEAFSAACSAAEHLFSRYKLQMAIDEAMADSEMMFFKRAMGKVNRSRYMLGFGFGLNAAYKRQEASSEFGIILTTLSDVLAAVEHMPTRATDVSAPRGDSNVIAGYSDGLNVGLGDRLTGAREA